MVIAQKNVIQRQMKWYFGWTTITQSICDIVLICFYFNDGTECAIPGFVIDWFNSANPFIPNGIA